MPTDRELHSGRFVRHHNLLIAAGIPPSTGPINKGKGRNNTGGQGHGKSLGGAGNPYGFGEAGAFAYNSASGVTSLNVDIPAGVKKNDILFLLTCYRAPSGVHDYNTPAGWTLVEQVDCNNNDNTLMALFWKRATSAESGSVTVTKNSDGGSPQAMGAIIWREGGCVRTGTPFTHAWKTNTGAAPTYASARFENDGTRVINAMAAPGSSLTYTPAAGFTEDFDHAGGSYCSVALHSREYPIAGASSQIAAVQSASANWGVITLALIENTAVAGAVYEEEAFTNPGAETSDTTGWTQTFGANFGVMTATADATPPKTGTYIFVCSTSGAYSEVRPVIIDVPSGLNTQVDAGEIEVDFALWRNDFSTDADTARVRLEFYDAAAGAGNFLGARATSDLGTANGQWIHEAITVNLPPDTRSVIAYVAGTRDGGTQLSFFFDDVQPLLFFESEETSEMVYASDGTDNTGWIVDTGTGQPTVDSSWSPWTYSGIHPGSQVSYAIHKDVLVSSLSAAAQAAIAVGDATLHLYREAWNENADDQSRTAVVTEDGGVDLDTIEDAAATTDWGTVNNVLRDASGAVDANTDTFRILHQYTRIDGTVLDAAVGRVYVWLTW